MASLVRGNRWAYVVLGLLGCLLPLTALAVRAAIRSNSNDVRDWLPAHFPETTQYRWFREQFGSEEFVVVSWPGCDLKDPRLAKLATELTARSAASDAAGKGSLFARVSTGAQMLAELTTPRFGTKPEYDDVVDRLKGTLIGPDGKQTCAVVTLSEESRRHLKSVLLEIRAAAVKIGVAAENVHLGGPSVVNDAIDQSSSQSLIRLAALAAVVGLCVAWLCFREIRLTLIVFFIAGYSAAMSLAVVPLCGVPLNAILITMVPLVYVAAMSGAIHLSNYYRESYARLNTDAAIGDAIRHAALPLGLATTTTAIGLVSLWYSDLFPIRLFGVFSAISVLIGLAMQLIALPALLCVWPRTKTDKPAQPRTKEEEELEIEPLSAGWQQFVSFITGYHRWLTLLFFVCIAASAVGLTKTTTSIQIMRLFAPSTPIIASYDWLEKNLGAMVPLEVVIRFDSENKQSTQERLELVRELHEAIAQTKGVSGCLSAATFTTKTKLRGKSFGNAMTSVRLKHTQTHLKEAGYLASTETEESWRISVRVTAGEDLDYGLFQQQLRAQVDPLLAREEKAGVHGISAVYTGAVPIVYKARRSLLDGLMLGFGTDVVLVVISVLLLLRNSSGGVLLFLTSIFPITIVFGLMGWFGWVIDIGSVMAPCVALGVSIDDAIHFVLRFRQGMDRGLSQKQSVHVAFAGCGQAMIQSWGVIALGLSVFALSQFIPTFRFGALTFALLTASTLCNLIFLPALLSGPLGRWLGATNKSAGQPQLH